MKKIILICAALALTGSAFAQKKNVNKVKNMIEYASSPINMDLSNLPADKLAEMRELLANADTDLESANMPETYKYKARLLLHDMNEMIQQRTANNNEFVDKKAFFKNQADIVKIYEKYEKVMTTPNEKGKLPVKEDEYKKEHALIQQLAQNPRNNLFIGASNLVYEDPAATVELLDAYYESFDNPLFEGLDLKNKDPYYKEGAYIYATAIKGAKGDEAKMVEYLNKALDSQNGALACQDLITYYKEKGDKAKETEMYELATKKFPEQLIFVVNLIQNNIIDKNFTKAVELSDQAIANMDNGTIKTVDAEGNHIEAARYPYYFRAVALYNLEKYEDAFAAFEKGVEFKQDYLDCIIGAGNTATRIASMNKDKKAIADSWYKKAIKYYEQAKELAPDQSDQWGYPLYASYYNSGNMAKAKQYEKYSK